MARISRNRASARAARLLAAEQGISYQQALQRVRAGQDERPDGLIDPARTHLALLEFYAPTAGMAEPARALAALGTPGADGRMSARERLQGQLEQLGLAGDDDGSSREPVQLLEHLHALLSLHPWLAEVLRLDDGGHTARARLLEQAIGNYVLVDHPAPAGMSEHEAHRLRAFMENHIDQFRGVASALMDAGR